MFANEPSSVPIDRDTLTSEFIAYEVSDTTGWSIRPAASSRDWMTNMNNGFPYRCLPLVVANQMGWVVCCPIGFEVTWNGRQGYRRTFSFHFDDDDDSQQENIKSHFGNGILTFRIPWLFRTPEGVGLLVRGPSNTPKAGIHPLEGFVETDWSPFTFTMNWKMSRPKFPIRFEKDEPICTLVPFPKRFLAGLTPRFASLEEAPELSKKYQDWRLSRDEFIARSERKPQEWQKHYLQGDEEATKAPETHLSLKPFDAE